MSSGSRSSGFLVDESIEMKHIRKGYKGEERDEKGRLGSVGTRDRGSRGFFLIASSWSVTSSLSTLT